MAGEFVTVPIETDQATLADNAIALHQAKWPDWTPDDGDMEVVQIENLAPMAADAASVAAVMPAAAFRTILSRLHRVLPRPGQAAFTTVTFTFDSVDPDRVIPEGFTIDVDGVAFSVDADTPATDLVTTGIPVTARIVGTVGNGLVGDVVTPVSAIVVDSITLDGPSIGGADAETDEELEDRGARRMRLQAETLVTTRDFELWSLENPAVERVVAVRDAATKTTTVVPGTSLGLGVPQTVKDDLMADFEELAVSNWNVAIEDPTVTTVDVTYSIHVAPGYDPAVTLTRVDETLGVYINPGQWGREQQFGDVDSARWYVVDRVRKNEVIALISSVEGVDYVNDVTLAGDAGVLEANGDWTLPGVVPVAALGVPSGTTV
jgi:hypothetical protein